MAHVVLAHFFCVKSFGRQLVKPFALCYRTLSLSKKGTQTPIFRLCLLQPNGCMDQNAIWYDGRPRPGNIVLDADTAAPPRDRAPNFGPCLSCLSANVGVLWPNGSTDQDETWRAGRPRTWPHCVRWKLRSPPQRDTAPSFRPISVVAKWLDGSRCHLVGR